MPKKNTLLYLDDRLVKKAKELNLNLSKIAENAIEKHLFPLLSTGERASIDFHNYLKQLEKEGQCYFLPFKLHHIMIKNIGIHSNLDLTLDLLNFIEGVYGSGKTTLIKLLAQTFGYDSTDFSSLCSFGRKSSEVTITIKPEKKIQLAYNRTKENDFREPRTIRCIIIDDSMELFTVRMKKEFLRYLKSLHVQVLLTTPPQKEIVYPKDYTIHELKNPSKEERITD